MWLEECRIHHIEMSYRGRDSSPTCPMCRNEQEMADKADETNSLLYEQGQHERERIELLREQNEEQGQHERERIELLREQNELARKRLAAEGACGRCGQRFVEMTRRRQVAGETWTGTLQGFRQEGVCPDCYFRRVDAKEVAAWTAVEWQGHLLTRLAAVKTLEEARSVALECRERGQQVVAAKAEDLASDLAARLRLDQAVHASATELLAEQFRKEGRVSLAAEADALALERRERELRAALTHAESASATKLLAEQFRKEGRVSLAAEADALALERRERELRAALMQAESASATELLAEQFRKEGRVSLAAEADALALERREADARALERRERELLAALMQAESASATELLAEQFRKEGRVSLAAEADALALERRERELLAALMQAESASATELLAEQFRKEGRVSLAAEADALALERRERELRAALTHAESERATALLAEQSRKGGRVSLAAEADALALERRERELRAALMQAESASATELLAEQFRKEGRVSLAAEADALALERREADALALEKAWVANVYEKELKELAGRKVDLERRLAGTLDPVVIEGVITDSGLYPDVADAARRKLGIVQDRQQDARRKARGAQAVHAVWGIVKGTLTGALFGVAVGLVVGVGSCVSNCGSSPARQYESRAIGAFLVASVIGAAWVLVASARRTPPRD